jgi:2-iminoacetate synthase ThiH
LEGEIKMKIDWREISACSYCKHYDPKKSYCNEEKVKKELSIYEELKGCEEIIFTGGLKIELFSGIPEDSILRRLPIKYLEKSNAKISNNIKSKQYGDYFNTTKSIEGNLNLSKSSSKEAKIISFEKFKEAQEQFDRRLIFNRMINNLPEHLK